MSQNHTTTAPPFSQDQMTLKIIARRVTESCPDMRQQALEKARDILRKHTGLTLSPDTVYWYRFPTAVSSNTTFNGWQHYGSPIESMTLPQLILHRFNAEDQDYADELQTMSGFYTAGLQAGTYDEHTEVKMLVSDVMNDLWALDFSAQYKTRLASFWQQCAEDFRTLSKANFLSKALEDRHSGHLSAQDFQSLIQAVASNVHAPIQLSMLTATTSAPAGMRVTAFDIGGHEASDILRIVTPQGRQIIYIPGEITPIRAFDTQEQVKAWLVSETAKVADRARFLSHFSLSMRHEISNDVGLNHLMDLLPAANASLINQNDRDLGMDAFTWLRDSARKRMNADANLSMRSNADLRKQMWIGYLNAFSHVIGPLAAIDWPVALAVVGAGLADMGLNIDQAVNGHTTAERKAGVIGAITSAVDVLFNSLFLISGFPETEPPVIDHETTLPVTSDVEPGIGPAITEASEVIPQEASQLPEHFKTTVKLVGSPVAQSGRMQGIYQLIDGSTYVSIKGEVYRVRFINEMNGWAIIDPNTPFSFYRNVPIRINAAGQWETLKPHGLRGGGPMASSLKSSRVNYPIRASAYDVPESMKQELVVAANGGDRKVLQGDWARPHSWTDPYIDFRALREQLRTDAFQFFKQTKLPQRPEMPRLEATDTCKSTLQKILANAPGLVIGESHAELGSKKFLIDNMRLLRKLNVRTLYMEHLLNDFHLQDLKTFAESGNMPGNLKTYLRNLDTGHHTDPMGQYTFLELVNAANENHIRIQPLDCMASYRLVGMNDPDGLLRIKMMNYFAHTTLQADAPNLGPKGKWLALVGNAHANTYEGVPGISELEGVIGIRAEDVSLGQPEGFSIDPGRVMNGEIGRLPTFVKSDFRMQMAINKVYPQPTIESRLIIPGMFVINRNTGSPLLIHRASDGAIVRTAIKTSRGKFFIERPRWQAISGRRFDNLGQLIDALKLMGMKDVT
ncbi:membrane-targeted effector domain-containing toxin [Pseudomonas cichorii]|uniref:membrane-targeted effector domain-containing toxin n=1 Tax=Pseudomonas cichorii TaxID=36746 RepID=UPI00190FFBC9|nr:membrane-targeted effector domain-containing toxin [Pseudomonas cichorii]